MYADLTLVGRISAPESKANAKGNLFIRVGLAVQPSKDAETTWFNLILSGKFAEVMQHKLQKGQMIFAKAHPVTSKDANGKAYINWYVDTLRIVGDNGTSETFQTPAQTQAPQSQGNAYQQHAAGSSAGYQQTPPVATAPTNSFGDEWDEDVPF